MSDDSDLLRRFVDTGSSADFAELVRRNAGLVYHAALRRTGGRADLAEEISQYVFTALAQNAPKLVSHGALAGWFFTTTRNAAVRVLRDERRRRERETKFAVMTEFLKPEAQVAWEKLRPEIDALLDQLPDADREAVLLRYLQGHSLADVGAELGLGADAVRKRIERAVLRLRAVLVKRGFMTSTAILAELLAGEAQAGAPAQLVQRLCGVVLKSAAPASSVSLAASGSALMVSGTAAVSLSLVIASLAVGISAYSMRTMRQARTDLADAMRNLSVAEQRLVAARATVGASVARSAGENAPTNVQAAAARPNATPATTGPTVARAEPLGPKTNGARFLAAVPEARERLLSFENTQHRAMFAGFYRAAGLTPTEIATFEQQVSDYHLSSIELSHNRMVTTAGDLPVDQVRTLLGDDRAQIYQQYLTEMPARGVALEAAATINYLAPVATPAQVDELTQALVEANPAFRATGKLELAAEDWSAAMPNLKARLSPEQWNAVSGLFLGYAYRQALRKAQAAAISPVAATPSPSP